MFLNISYISKFLKYVVDTSFDFLLLFLFLWNGKGKETGLEKFHGSFHDTKSFFCIGFRFRSCARMKQSVSIAHLSFSLFPLLSCSRPLIYLSLKTMISEIFTCASINRFQCDRKIWNKNQTTEILVLVWLDKTFRLNLKGIISLVYSLQ